MQKITMTTLMLALSTMISFSQDIILKKSGDEIAAKIIEIGTTEIKYKDFGTDEGPILTLLKSDIFMIKYKNGAKEIFVEEETESTTLYSEEELLAKGKQDATINYTGKKGRGRCNHCHNFFAHPIDRNHPCHSLWINGALLPKP